MNGVVERRFFTDRIRAKSMIIADNLKKELCNLLWAEAVCCAEYIGNLSPSPNNKDISKHEAFNQKKPKLINHLVQFGKIGYIMRRNE